MQFKNILNAVFKNFKDEGEGVITFPKGLTITDDTEQWNGTKYDIQSLNISEFSGKLTANHSSDIREVIGETLNVRKGKGRVVIDGIRFAVKENALAQFAYNMLKGGFLTDFSIETIGDFPDDGVYQDHSLVGLSLVVVGNNKSAALSSVAMNSLDEARKNGLDTKGVETLLCKSNLINKGNESERNDASADISYKEESMEEKETTPTEAPEEVTPTEAPAEEVVEKKEDNSALEATINKLIKPVLDKLEATEQKLFDKGVEEPKFTKNSVANKATNEFSGMSYNQRHGKQIEYAWNWLKSGSATDREKLMDINKYHMEELQKAGKVDNQITLADFGNFVISPELLTDIEGHRSNFSDLLSILEYRETLSLQMSWLKRDGDVDMTEVEMCADGADGNLKPVKEYDANILTANLHELAAVTPVCNAATRFLAADLLGDVAQGYRTDYDRKRAQLAIARMQQAVDATGNSATYATTSDTAAIQSFIETLAQVAEQVMGGTFIFNHSTYWKLVQRLVGAGISGPLSALFTTGNQPAIVGRPYIVVPDELMPTIDTATTKSFTVEGSTITVNQGVFYVDPTQFSGRISGGLRYDLSTEAAYEIDGSVRSAFQRNELVLRGSFFRAGAIRDTAKVAGLAAPGVS